MDCLKLPHPRGVTPVRDRTPPAAYVNRKFLNDKDVEKLDLCTVLEILNP